MAPRFRARPGRLLAIALSAAAFIAVLGGSVAFAADQPVQLDPATLQQLFQQLQSSPVISESCGACHGNIADTDNYSSEIVFTHANHIMLQCSSCHTKFPHRPEGTARPTMKGCSDCHGLKHGPMGELASGKCEDCHKTPKERLRPGFHTYDWAGKPHVKPAEKEFNSNCAMCHTPASCDDCHQAKGINWAPDDWAYNSGDGCNVCHGNAFLQKQAISGSKSYQVSGVKDSAHQDYTCQDCHVDFRYDDKPAATPLWTVNAGQACADCHEKQKDKRLSDPVAEYDKSTHAKAIEDGNFDSATCGSCHGGHFIARTMNNPLEATRLQGAAYRVCARCHNDPDSPGGPRYDTYNDYYHGRAYKKGAPDAPACWDCHGSHKILPSTDPESSMSAENRGDTCGQKGCHRGSTQEFGTEASALIHQKTTAEAENPLLRLIANITGQ